MYPSPIRQCKQSRKKAATVEVASEQRTLPHLEPDCGGLEDRLRSLEEGLHHLATVVAENQNPRVQGLGSDNLSSRSGSNSIQEGTLGNVEASVDSAPSLPNSDQAGTLSIRQFPLSADNSIYTTQLQPSHDQARIIWCCFKESADQQIKVVHRPNARSILEKALKDPSTLDASQKTLLFAIYFATVVSMKEEQVRACFGMESKDAALSAYRAALQGALVTADFLGATDLNTMQALVLFVAFSQFAGEWKRVWALTGLARRLNPASMTRAGSPFEMEMRRRMWWHLWYLDRRATLSDGEEEDVDDVPLNLAQMPEFPLNVYDEDLWPAMHSLPTVRNAWTPISFSLLRFTFGQTTRQLESISSKQNQEGLIQQCVWTVQQRYLQYCNGSEPIHWLAQHVAYVLMTELRIKKHTPPHHRSPHYNNIAPYQSAATVSSSSSSSAWSMDRDHLIHTVLDILNIPTRLHHEPEAQRWKWLLSPFPLYTHLSFLINCVLDYQIRAPPVTALQRWMDTAECAFQKAAESVSDKRRQALERSLREAQARMLIGWTQRASMNEAVEDISQTRQILPNGHVEPLAADVGPLDMPAMAFPTELCSGTTSAEGFPALFGFENPLEMSIMEHFNDLMPFAAGGLNNDIMLDPSGEYDFGVPPVV